MLDPILLVGTVSSTQMPELFDELRPRNRASISLRGGLNAGRRDTWLEGYLP